jgi:hypothetical protein
MNELINFYFNPYRFTHKQYYDIFFKNSLILYFTTIILYSFLSFFFLDDWTLSTSPIQNRFTFVLIKTISLLLKEPIQILFITTGVYIFLSLIFKQNFSFIAFYKLLFIAFNIVIFSYFIDIANIVTKHFNDFYFLNLFKFSLNDIFIKIYDCSQPIVSFLSRINLLLLLSLIYSFFLFKNEVCLSSNKLIILTISISVLLILLLFSFIPMFFLSLFKLASA